jgi:hypothetical protein
MKIVYFFLTLTNSLKATEIAVNKANQDYHLEDQFLNNTICTQWET